MKLDIPKLEYKGTIKESEKQPGLPKPKLGHKAPENDIIKMRWTK